MIIGPRSIDVQKPFNPKSIWTVPEAFRDHPQNPGFAGLSARYDGGFVEASTGFAQHS
jgi:hypothetical protein